MNDDTRNMIIDDDNPLSGFDRTMITDDLNRSQSMSPLAITDSSSDSLERAGVVMSQQLLQTIDDTNSCDRSCCQEMRTNLFEMVNLFQSMQTKTRQSADNVSDADQLREINRQQQQFISHMQDRDRIVQDELNALKVSKLAVERKYVELMHRCETMTKNETNRQTPDSTLIALRNELDATKELLETSDERRVAIVEKYKNTVQFAKAKSESADAAEKRNKKLEQQVDSLKEKLDVASKAAKKTATLQGLLDELCGLIEKAGLMTRNFKGRLNRLNGISSSTHVRHQHQRRSASPSSPHLQQLADDIMNTSIDRLGLEQSDDDDMVEHLESLMTSSSSPPPTEEINVQQRDTNSTKKRKPPPTSSNVLPLAKRAKHINVSSSCQCSKLLPMLTNILPELREPLLSSLPEWTPMSPIINDADETPTPTSSSERKLPKPRAPIDAATSSSAKRLSKPASEAIPVTKGYNTRTINTRARIIASNEPALVAAIEPILRGRNEASDKTIANAIAGVHNYRTSRTVDQLADVIYKMIGRMDTGNMWSAVVLFGKFEPKRMLSMKERNLFTFLDQLSTTNDDDIEWRTLMSSIYFRLVAELIRRTRAGRVDPSSFGRDLRCAAMAAKLSLAKDTKSIAEPNAMYASLLDHALFQSADLSIASVCFLATLIPADNFKLYWFDNVDTNASEIRRFLFRAHLSASKTNAIKIAKAIMTNVGCSDMMQNTMLDIDECYAYFIDELRRIRGARDAFELLDDDDKLKSRESLTSSLRRLVDVWSLMPIRMLSNDERVIELNKQISDIRQSLYVPAK